jgi:hypothetical protein
MIQQYVQHISGQGEKWLVYSEYTDGWKVLGRTYFLPKSEYRLCEPSERWVDVTGECTVNEYGSIV